MPLRRQGDKGFFYACLRFSFVLWNSECLLVNHCFKISKGGYPLAISRQQKEEFVTTYTEQLSRSEAAYLTDYRGLNVAAMSGLRAQLREETNAELTVAKNRLLKIALKQAGWAIPEEQLKGPTAILFCFDDAITAAKVLTRYVKQNEMLTIKGGVMQQSVMDEQGVQKMAELPSREVILATLIGTLQAPAQSLLRTLQAPAQELFGTINAPLRELTNVLHARSESEGE
jgi:large subunit ribosomal protein L10